VEVITISYDSSYLAEFYYATYVLCCVCSQSRTIPTIVLILPDLAEFYYATYDLCRVSSCVVLPYFLRASAKREAMHALFLPLQPPFACLASVHA